MVKIAMAVSADTRGALNDAVREFKALAGTFTQPADYGPLPIEVVNKLLDNIARQAETEADRDKFPKTLSDLDAAIRGVPGNIKDPEKKTEFLLCYGEMYENLRIVFRYSGGKAEIGPSALEHDIRNAIASKTHIADLDQFLVQAKKDFKIGFDREWSVAVDAAKTFRPPSGGDEIGKVLVFDGNEMDRSYARAQGVFDSASGSEKTLFNEYWMKGLRSSDPENFSTGFFEGVGMTVARRYVFHYALALAEKKLNLNAKDLPALQTQVAIDRTKGDRKFAKVLVNKFKSDAANLYRSTLGNASRARSFYDPEDYEIMAGGFHTAISSMFKKPPLAHPVVQDLFFAFPAKSAFGHQGPKWFETKYFEILKNPKKTPDDERFLQVYRHSVGGMELGTNLGDGLVDALLTSFNDKKFQDPGAAGELNNPHTKQSRMDKMVAGLVEAVRAFTNNETLDFTGGMMQQNPPAEDEKNPAPKGGAPGAPPSAPPAASAPAVAKPSSFALSGFLKMAADGGEPWRGRLPTLEGLEVPAKYKAAVEAPASSSVSAPAVPPPSVPPRITTPVRDLKSLISNLPPVPNPPEKYKNQVAPEAPGKGKDEKAVAEDKYKRWEKWAEDRELDNVRPGSGFSGLMAAMKFYRDLIKSVSFQTD